jgi:hypothetical protein
MMLNNLLKYEVIHDLIQRIETVIKEQSY